MSSHLPNIQSHFVKEGQERCFLTALTTKKQRTCPQVPGFRRLLLTHLFARCLCFPPINPKSFEDSLID